ncbi:helix-turn-helix transcriptional regulator [Novosphingobium umbonatum]|uniref:Helix-turn-helix transcriptional regulator n=1 Tax=Novosphingobium umbonatum TaxID=1908524 RepID=A0A437N016_9SPHN|nr:helix-turn-helix transcriptional regulator [Novosphingobium umbonatum]RVU03239.1 helix-turn-helix transcriptional regulator [Novosphingobium umbonatum]
MRLDLDGLYAAIDDDKAFSTLSLRLAEAAGTRSAVFVELEAGGVPVALQAKYWSDDIVGHYIQDYIHQDPWTALGVKVGRFDRAAALDAIMTPEQFQQTAIYNELYRAYGDDTGRCLAVVPNLAKAGVMLAVHRAASDAAFTAKDQAGLDDIYRHLNRILSLRQMVGHARDKAASLQDLADQSDQGLVRVDKDLRVLGLSARAQQMFDQRDGLALRNSRIDVTPALHAALKSAVAAMIDRNMDAQSGFLCRRPSGLRPYRIVVLPAGFHGQSGAILKLDDPEAHPAPATMMAVQNAYGLSNMEAALAQNLLAEKSVEEIAAGRGVGRETIKSQMKSLFHKTGVSRQTSLLKLLATFPRRG